MSARLELKLWIDDSALQRDRDDDEANNDDNDDRASFRRGSSPNTNNINCDSKQGAALAAVVNIAVDCVLYSVSSSDARRDTASSALLKSSPPAAASSNHQPPSSAGNATSLSSSSSSSSLYLWIHSAPDAKNPAALIKRAFQRGPAMFVTETLTSSISSCSAWTKCVCVMRETAPISGDPKRHSLKSRAGSASSLRRCSSIVAAASAYDPSSSLMDRNGYAPTPRRFAGTTTITCAPGRLAKRRSVLAVGVVVRHNGAQGTTYVPVVVNETPSASSGGIAVPQTLDAIFIHHQIPILRSVGGRRPLLGSSLVSNGGGEDGGELSILSEHHHSLRGRRGATFVGGGCGSPMAGAAAVATCPMEFHKRFFLVRDALLRQEHCEKLQERYHLMVASSTTEHRVCLTLVSQLQVPLELYGGMYGAKTQWFISALADAMLLTSMLRAQQQQQANTSTNTTASSSSVASDAATRLGDSVSVGGSMEGERNALRYFLDPGAVINVLLRCCRDTRDMLCSRFRGDIDDGLIMAEMGAANNGASGGGGSVSLDNATGTSRASMSLFELRGAASGRSASTASAHLQPNPTLRSLQAEASRAHKSAGTVDGAAAASQAARGGGGGPTHFSVEWFDFCLLSTVGHEGWTRVLLPLVDRYHAYPPLLERTRLCQPFRHQSMDQLREHIAWVASSLKPPHMRTEDFYNFLDRVLPPWAAASSTSSAAFRATKSFAGSRRNSDGLRLNPSLATAASGATPPPWVHVFLRSTGRSAAKLGVLTPKEWIDELHVTPCRVIWCLLPRSLTDMALDTSSRRTIFLSTVRRAARNTRLTQTYALSLASTLLHNIMQRYLHRWLAYHRQRREFLRKRTAICGAMIRKSESRLLGSFFHRWRNGAIAKLKE